MSDPAADQDRLQRVAVIIPVYNGERFLDETLRSIRSQTHTNVEVIVVNDGSTDGSEAIARQHALVDDRVRVITQANEGLVAARNTAIRLTDAPYIALIDQDDVALPTRLGRQVQFLVENTDVAALGTYGWRIGGDGRELGVFDVGPVTREEFAGLHARNEVIYLLASSVMFRRDVAVSIGGFREVEFADDADLWTRIADDHIVLGLPERLVRYRVHPGSASSMNFFRQMESARLVKVNCSRRRGGLPEIGIDELRADLAAEPLHARIRRKATWRSQYWYRLAGGRLANRDPSGLVWLAMSFALAPAVPVTRLRRQLVPWLRSRR